MWWRNHSPVNDLFDKYTWQIFSKSTWNKKPHLVKTCEQWNQVVSRFANPCDETSKTTTLKFILTKNFPLSSNGRERPPRYQPYVIFWKQYDLLFVVVWTKFTSCQVRGRANLIFFLLIYYVDFQASALNIFNWLYNQWTAKKLIKMSALSTYSWAKGHNSTFGSWNTHHHRKQQKESFKLCLSLHCQRSCWFMW